MTTGCDHCGRRFKVFSKRRKCAQCMITVCRTCFDAHLVARHPNATASAISSSASASSASALAYSVLTGLESVYEDEDVHFHSPLHANNAPPTTTTAAQVLRPDPRFLDSGGGDLDDLDAVAVEDHDDLNSDNEDGDEDMLLGPYSRRSSIEEEVNQFREFTQLQRAVENWTRRELALRRERRLTKHASMYAMRPVPHFTSAREQQRRELFAVAYAVFVTVIVWGVYVASMGLYLRVGRRVLPHLPIML